MTGTDRYNRQTILPEIGTAGQARLADTRVLVVGAGGLGCPALQYLAAAGIGTIGIVDDDVVDITNLQRQVLFTTAQQGTRKVDAAAKAITALNPEIRVNTHPARLLADNAEEIMSGYDIILDGTDNFAAKFLINDAAVKLGKPVAYGSILGFEGQACIFRAEKGACYRCLHPAPPTGHVPGCAEAGVIGALAGIVGSVQAMDVIRLAVGNPDIAPETGALWMIDARTMQSYSIRVPKNPDCPVCSKPPEHINLTDLQAGCTFVPEITATEAKQADDHVFIDVRDADEWQQGHIEGALHCPLPALQESVLPEDVKPETPCIVYCKTGMRSRTACKILQDKGFENIRLLRGGFDGW